MYILIYFFLFLLLSQVVFYFPGLGILLYLGFLAYVICQQKKRTQRYREYYQQQNSSDNNHASWGNAAANESKKVKDAIDVEYREEEL